MASNFINIEDSQNFTLNYIVYIIQCFGCFFSLVPLIFVLHCWITKPFLRTRRTMFTVYLSIIDSIGRLIYLIYYVIQLLAMDEKYFINDDDCSYLTYFLYNASAWPLSSVILLQLHTFVASVNVEKYERLVGHRICLITMAACFVFDLVVATFGHFHFKDFMAEKKWFSLTQDCKFEFFSRFSLIHSWKIFIQLLAIGLISVSQLIVVIIKRLKKDTDLSNPVANSPFYQWKLMTKSEKFLTVVMQTIGAISFILFIVNYIVFLIKGNSDDERILTLSITFFVFVGPLEMIWFNVDLRDAFLKKLTPKNHEETVTTKKIESRY